MYKLYIDDVRNPGFDPDQLRTVIARTSKEAIKVVKKQGLPVKIAFDHDLGGNNTTIKFIHWLINYFIDHEKLTLPPGFSYDVHSSNPPGAENIRGLMNNLITFSVSREGKYDHFK